MTFKILLDDLRNDDGFPVNGMPIPKMDMIIRNPMTYYAIKPILSQIKFVLFIDHDLGYTTEEQEKNGYQIITDMLSSGTYPELVKIVSSNPVGRKNIEAALRHEGYYCNGIGEWTR